MSGTYKVTFMPMNVSVEVDPAKAPYTRVGLPGSILDIAMTVESKVELDHICGGLCACATCHVIVRQGLDSCNNEQDEEELDMLDMADDVEDHSRLACQCVPSGQKDLVVEIPPR